MFDHPYASFLSRLERPGRYLGGEFGAAAAKVDPKLRIALAFPDAYEIGMSHIGLSVLYEIVNGHDLYQAERVFMPWPDLEKELVGRDLPLVSLETATPLIEFDLIGFSLQYELCYTNVIAMLDLARISRRASGRNESDPIIIVGGPVATHCEPIAPFVDVVFVGDGEEEFPHLLQVLADEKDRNSSRRECIEKLGCLSFAYAPNLLERTRGFGSNREVIELDNHPAAVRAAVSSLGAHPTGCGPVPMTKSVFDRFSFEVARGCTAGCRFCQAGFLYRPVRERNESEAVDAVTRAFGCLGFDDISLAALSTADHSRIRPMVARLGEEFTPRGVSFSVPSLRAHGLEEEFVDVLASLRATNVTLAPEAGSQRLRDVINKNVTKRDLMEAAAQFFSQGITRIKLYFMLGLPTETERDLVEIIELASDLRHFGSQVLSGRKPAVTVSVSTFVPKPFTPFEREPMAGLEEIRAKHQLLRDLGRKKKLEVRVHGPDLSVLEGILCRGDVSYAPLLEKAVDMGARFDSWKEMYKADVWRETLANVDIPSALGRIPQDGRVPWDHVDVGVDPKFLAKEGERARRQETTEPCGLYVTSDAKTREFICHTCGIGCKKDSLNPRTKRPKRDPNEDIPFTRVKKLRPRPSPSTKSEVPSRTRLFYAKWGRQSYIGHLDTMRHILYSLRRAGLSLSYTKGFHPKPKMESAPPLPLGTAGLLEPIDVFLINPPSNEQITDLLFPASPPDLRFIRAETIGPGTKSLSKQIQTFEYVAFVPSSLDEATAGLEKLLGAGEIVFVRNRKGKTSSVDIRPYVLNAEISNVSPKDVRLPADPARVGVGFSLAVPGSGGAKPIEVLRTIFKEPEDPWIVRTQVVLGSGK